MCFCTYSPCPGEIPWHHHARCETNHKKEMQQHELRQASKWKEVITVKRFFLFPSRNLFVCFWFDVHFPFPFFLDKDGLYFSVKDAIMFTFFTSKFKGFALPLFTFQLRMLICLYFLQANALFALPLCLKCLKIHQTCFQHSVLWFCKNITLCTLYI